MNLTCLKSFVLACSAMSVALVAAEEIPQNAWTVSSPILQPGPLGSFDEVSVKDPTVVFFDGMWHVFYTATSKKEYTTGYVSAAELAGLQAARRYELEMVRGKSRYGCAPQVFYYEPQRQWYLIFQNRDANYQPAFSTTKTISKPDSWSKPKPLLRKKERAKWIDFWVICDDTKAYCFYTRSQREVFVKTTRLEDFPCGWGKGQKILSGIHEAAHLYKVKDRKEFHLIYELNHDGKRSFGLAISQDLLGPWKKATDAYATGEQLRYEERQPVWTEMVSHGEAIRTGFDQKMEYEPNGCRWLIQGLLEKDSKVPYSSLPWKLGVLRKNKGVKENKGVKNLFLGDGKF